MAMFELFGVGRGWAGAFKADPIQERRTTYGPGSLISATALKMNEASTESAADTARSRFRKASGALQAAFGGFIREAPAINTPPALGRSASAAAVAGMSARLDPIGIDYFGVQATNEVNSRTSTVRSSWAAIGLDAASPESASFLESSASLGLDVVGAASVKTSKDELNTGAATSYGTNSLTFTGSGGTSASIGSLSGTYKGLGKAADATALEVTVTKGGTIESGGLFGLNKTRIAFEVTDQTGEVVFSYSGNVAAGDIVSLGSDIGLSLAFGAGALTTGHKASTTVSKTETTVDPDARFNAAPGGGPKFDAVSAVIAGSFTVNNTAIQVFADDTINTVLDRISNSGAGVTATISGDKVTLASKGNSDQNIDIASDTSGFVKAVKLEGATTIKGNLRDDDRLLKDTTVFRDVRTGSFTINGRTIAVNKDQDTLATVLDRINGSGAGVSATLNLTTNRIEIVSTAYSEDVIDVGNDSTGLLALAQLRTANTVVGNIRDDRQILGEIAEFGSVTSGSFRVNGVSIAVNSGTDSLASIIGRINTAGAGVTASYDAATDRFTVTPDIAGATLSIEGDTSGLLAALKLASGTAATRANADGAFNATGVDGPLLDAGRVVQAGSLTINGVSISVAADDTINSVMAKITASDAGVIAAYDAATDRVSLTSIESGAPVMLGADTSGFLAAVKLDQTATTSVSTVSYSSFNTALGEMAEYAGVTTGTLTVNGSNVAIDPMTTTITGLVGALNGLGGVSATIDQATGAIRISGGSTLTLSDTSGVLAALGIEAGSVRGKAGTPAEEATRTRHSTPSNGSEVARKVSAALDELNDAIEGVSGDAMKTALEGAVDRLRDQGIRGFHVSGDDERTVVSVASEDLIDSLEAVADDLDLDKALASILDALQEAIASAAGWNASPRVVQAVALQTTHTQLMAEQTAGSLLNVRSSLQPQDAAETTRKTALRAYAAQS